MNLKRNLTMLGVGVFLVAAGWVSVPAFSLKGGQAVKLEVVSISGPTAAWAADATEEEPKANPYGHIKVLAAALAVGLCAWATGYAQSRIGAAGMGAMAEKPELAPMCIVLLALPETIVILGFVVAAMIVMF